MKLNKKLSIWIALGILVAVPIVTVTSVSIAQQSLAAANEDEKIFDYAMKNTVINAKETETYNSKWSLTMNNTNEIMYFDSPEAMQLKLSSHIEQTYANTSYSLNDYVDPATGILGGNQDGDDLWSHLNLGTADEDLNVRTVYRGSDGQIFTDLDEAKESYVQLHETYYFNDIYFNTKEELRKYLLDEYFYNQSADANTITLKAPDKTISAPINLDDPNFETIVSSFVENNTTKVLKYDRTKIENGETKDDKTLYFSAENYKSNYNELNLNDLDYQYIESNQGKSQYILDLDASDSHNLFAPYIYEGTLDIGSFSNKDSWKKVENKNNEYVAHKNSIFNDAIGKFFSFLLAEDQQISNALTSYNYRPIKLFNIPEIKIDASYGASLNELVNFDDYYLNQLESENVNLYQDVLEMYNTITRGKRYNAFYKIPILYSYIIQRIVSYNMSQNILDLTVSYFSEICDYLQDCLQTMLMDQELFQNINQANIHFSLKEFFHIGDPQYDINTNIEVYMEMLKSQYPLLAGAISFAITGINDLAVYANLFSTYDSNRQNLEKFKIINNDNYYLFESKKTSFRNIYELFRSENLETLTSIIEANTNFPDADNSNFFNKENYLQLISFTLHNFTINANEFILKDFEKVNSKGKYNGIASDLPVYRVGDVSYGPVVVTDFSRFFANKSKILKELIENTNITPYQIYILFYLESTIYGYKNIPRTVNTWQSLSNGISALMRDLNAYTSAAGVLNFTNIINESANYWCKIFSESPREFSSPAIAKYPTNGNVDTGIYEAVDVAIKIISLVINMIEPLMTLAYMVPFIGPLIDIVFQLTKAFIPETTKYYYIYTTASNDQFVWDGGSETKTFFNWISVSSSTNANMKLLDPIQLVLPQLQSCYYYNQKRYYSPEEIKRDQLQYMMANLINGKPLNSKKRFSYIYTFDSIPFSENAKPDDYDELNKFTSHNNTKDVVQTVLANINKYVDSSITAFSDGFKSTSDISWISHLTDNIITNIRPTWIMLKPLLDDQTGLPIKTSANRTFVLPGKSWTSVAGLYTNKDIAHSEYLIDNSANGLKANHSPSPDGTVVKNDYFNSSPFQASDLSKVTLLESFKQFLEVESKDVLISEYLNKNNFDDLNEAFHKQVVYRVILPNKQTEYFTDISKAQRWLAQNLQMNKIGDYETVYTYEFAGMTFNSIAELKQWVLSNKALVQEIRGN